MASKERNRVCGQKGVTPGVNYQEVGEVGEGCDPDPDVENGRDLSSKREGIRGGNWTWRRDLECGRLGDRQDVTHRARCSYPGFRIARTSITLITRRATDGKIKLANFRGTASFAWNHTWCGSDPSLYAPSRTSRQSHPIVQRRGSHDAFLIRSMVAAYRC
jgi:hypothetical protein